MTSSPRRRLALAAGLVAVLAVAGCGGSPDGTADQPTGSATTSPGATGSASPTSPSASGSPAVSLQPFEILAESDLPILPNFAYIADAGQDDAIRTQGTKESINLAFSGAIARQLLYQGQQVGGVQVWRFRGEPSVSTQVQLLTFMVGGFGGREPVTGTLNGVPVAQVENAQGSDIAAVGFLTGTELVVVWSQGAEAAQRLAVTYLAAAGVTGVVPEGSPSASPSS
jgi:hypothetical protein